MDILVEPLTVVDKEAIVREVIERFLIPRFIELNLNSSGQWVETAHARGASIYGQDYTQYLVRGRGPNADQDPKALAAWAVYYGKTVFAEWVAAKGLDLDPIAVAYNVAKYGTKIKEQGGTDLLEVLKSRECLEFINTKVRDFVAIQIEVQFKREIKKAFK